MDIDHLQSIAAHCARTTEHLEGFHFRDALGEMMALARAANGYLDVKKPWAQRKEDLAACGTTINVCIQTVKALMVLMSPFMPHSAARCAEQLALDPSPPTWESATEELSAGHQLGEPKILFTKLDPAELFADEKG